MAQTGYTPIQLYYSTTASAVPTSGNLANGELAINITDGKLYYKNNSGTVTVLAGAGGTGIVAGSNTQIQFNNSGVFGASANFTWDGTTVSTTGLSSTGLSTLVKTVKIGDSNFSGVAVFAPGTPAKLYIGTGTVTDTTSAIGATNAVGAISSLAITPIAATNTSVTYTNASTLYIAGAPSAGTNVTITNPYSLWVNDGTAFLNGPVILGSTLAINGAVDFNNTTNSTSPTTGAVVIDGGVGIAKSLYVGGDIVVTKSTSGSYIRLESTAPYGFPGNFTIQAGGQSTPALTITDNTAAQERLTILTGETIFNEAGADQDFRIESDGVANMFFIDAGNNRIGINTNVPSTTVNIAAAYDNFMRFDDTRTAVSGSFDSYLSWYSYVTTNPIVKLGVNHNDYFGATRKFFIDFSADGPVAVQRRLEMVNGETVFNQDSADVDFRVESDANTHMLFLDAGNNEVIIGTNGGINNASLHVLAAASRQAITAQVTSDGNSLFQGFSSAGGSAVFQVTGTGALTANAQITTNGNLFVGGSASTTTPALDRAVYLQSTTNNSSIGYSMYINDGANNRRGSMFLNDSTGVWGFDSTASSGVPIYKFYRAATEVFGIGDEVVVNESGADIDFRVESDANTHMLFVDASSNVVTVALSSPVANAGALQIGAGGATDSSIGINHSDNATISARYGLVFQADNQDTIGGRFHSFRVGGKGYSDGRLLASFLEAECVFNDDSRDQDFRVESDANTHMLFVDAGQDAVSVGTSSINNGASLGVYASSGISQVNWGINGNSQGSPQFARVVRYVTSAGSSNKLVIPFLSQGSLNSNTVCRVMVLNAQFNTASPLAVDFTFAVGHLNALYNLTSWGTGGNFSSIAINGMNVEITFTSAYSATGGEAGGLFLTLEYMSNNLTYSIQPDSIVMA